MDLLEEDLQEQDLQDGELSESGFTGLKDLQDCFLNTQVRLATIYISVTPVLKICYNPENPAPIHRPTKNLSAEV